MLLEHSLHFGGIYIFATADDHILEATHNVEVTLLVPAPHIAGMEPAITQSRSSCFGVFPITGAHMRTFDQELTCFADRYIIPIRIKQAYLTMEDWLAHRAYLAKCIFIRH